MEKEVISNVFFERLKKHLKRDSKLKAKKEIDDLCGMFLQKNNTLEIPKSNNIALELFLKAKRIEGSSERTIKYYKSTLKLVLDKIKKVYYLITTDDIRTFLSDYKTKNNVQNITIDNVRRVVSSFFCWLENEDYIYKSPTKRIHKVKIVKKVKETYDDETIEMLKKTAKNIRDLAIINLLLSTGMRVGELVKLNVNDIDLNNKECIVLGKGNKQRKVYFDIQTKISLNNYIESRKDDNEALFVSLIRPYKRLNISGIEIMLRKLGLKIGIKSVHPHKFRRTIATKAIDKGMPIEQVQHMLGHTKIDTTLEYAIVDDENVKNSHKKYLQ